MATTIFAKSSGAGRAAIAVWRISGPAAEGVLTALVGSLPSPRRASHRVLRDRDGGVIDDGVVLWFPGPKTATGEDLVELQLHGSVAVSKRLTAVLSGMGLVPAAAGEFTLRALRNGRIGLLEAEGLGDLLDAETEAQRQQALASYDGHARGVVADWRDGLIGALAALEAAVDFPDEEDIPEEISARALPALTRVRDGIARELENAVKGQRIREGLTLAIVGPPNAGKSTILNRLLGEDRAIVSDIAGTTRDVVSARLEMSGRLIEVLDTAGLRAFTHDPIERAGMEKTRAVLERADLIVAVSVAGEAEAKIAADPEKTIRLTNKLDLDHNAAASGLALSAKTGEGWDAFLSALSVRIENAAAPALFTHDRQISLLTSGVALLDDVLSKGADDVELLAEDVRAVISLLDQITGRITVEDVLGAIFSRFCIGK